MWLICNGAPKNGSTWLVSLLYSTNLVSRIPDSLQNDAWLNPSVSDDLINQASETLPISNVYYFSKQHWSNRHAELLSIPGIKVINIIRDIRDTVISNYHHDVRVNGEVMSLSQYINKKSFVLIKSLCDYFDYWITNAVELSPSSYYITSYEYLSTQLGAASADLYRFIGFDMTQEEMNRACNTTLFSKKKETGEGKFFRKGKSLAYADEIDKSQQEYILSICEELELRKIKQKMAKFNPSIEPYLKMTDVGV